MPDTNLTVTLNANGTVTVSGGATVEENQRLTFQPAGNATSVSSLRVTTGDATSFSTSTDGNNLVASSTEAGNYEYEVAVRDSGGQTYWSAPAPQVINEPGQRAGT